MVVLLRCCLVRRRQLLQLVFLCMASEVGSGQLHYSVPEESQHGTFVGRIAQDLGLEVDELMPRMFRMESQGHGNYLEVNVQNGILFVNSRIDREELCAKSPLCSIHLEVIVDKPLRVFHVEVEIKDINDNAPAFPQKEQNVFVSELRTPGSFFPLEGASDADIGPNSRLSYTLSPSEYFSLDVQRKNDESQSLGLLLKTPLDREVKAVHRLLLTAIDGGKPELSGTAQLVISVLDENDNAPAFNQSVYKVQMTEDVPSGTLVIRLNATDLDEAVNKEITYSFQNRVPVKLKNIFTLDSITGEIRTKEKLDFEENHQYEILVQASDKGSNPMTGYCSVVIDVLDVNDNAPEMLLKSLSVPVPEDSPPGTVVALLSVSDRDSGANGQMSCSLHPPGLPFKLVSTFKNYYSLVVAEPLDREQVAEYKVVVTAQDQGAPSLSTTSSLVVPISDVNDNAPTFPQSSYTVFVKENNPPGAHIFTVSASDPDVAENGLVSYWLDEKLWPLSSYISVHSESGKLYALQPLDYEEMKLLEFQVRAKDAGLPSLCGNVTVQVFVVDENDNAPAVSGPSEEAPVLLVIPVMAGHLVGKIRALDADSGYNAWLRYELPEATNGPWRVGLYSGEISTTRVLDEGESSGRSQNLLVLVKDHGKPALSATATLSVSLVPNAQASKTDTHLSRTGGGQKPLVDNVNVYLIIAICSVSSLFLLVIIVYMALRCQSQAKEAMTYGPGTATLVCASEVGSWSYSNRHSHILAGVSGEPGIKSDLMVFSPNIPPPPGSEKQEQILCDTSVQLHLKQIFESHLSMVIMWIVSLRRRLLLQLALLHTAWQVGSGQLHYSVPEESQHGTFVGRIAQDLGLEVSELVPRLFRMESQGRGEYFRVNLQNGILFVNTRIDREELCGKSPLCSIHLEVIVDKPLKVFHVEVEIADINDNAPAFSVAEQTLVIAESRLPHSPFPLESASDADIGTNALLTYAINPNDYFRLSVVTSEDQSKSAGLELKKPLDREDISVHHLLLTATDGGKPELTGTVQLVINVLDVNDNAPLFNQSVYKVRLPENTANGTLIIALNATDLDEGIFKDVAYSFSNLVSSKVKHFFQINEHTGEIKVTGPLDYEDINLWEIQVVAEDKGNPPLAGRCKVVIEIQDMNDNAPELLLKSLSVPVREDSPLGTMVALISVSDRDSGANGQVSCSLWPAELPFKLVSNFKHYYSLVLEAPLDREQVAEYVLVVMARDEGTPSLSASSSLVVPIADVNDNAPTFTQPTYTIFVKENNPPGAHIFTVSASDPDVAENGLVSYWLDEKLWPLSSYISVHSESGKLYALQSLDYEEMKLLEFQVTAKDAGLPSLCGNVTVQVFVVDENDNAPAVSGPAEDTPALLVVPVAAGHLVGKVRAVDADSGYNAWLRYELHETNNNSPWRVGLYSGEISTTLALEGPEYGVSQSLLVLVKDHGKPVLSATATLSVSLVASAQTVQADDRLSRMGSSPKPLADNANVYLIIAICSVSSLFLLVIIVYMALRCQCQAKEAMTYGPGTATLVCASEVGSWSYSNRHSHILAGVAGEAGGKSDLMVFSPNVPVFAVNGEAGNAKELVPNSSGEPKPPNPDWRYSASLRAGMQGAVHMEEAAGLRGGPGGPEQQWPTVSSATTEPEAGEVSPPVGAGVNSNSWTFKYGPGNSKQPGPGELPDKFIIPGSPAIISIRQDPPNSQTDKSDFITFGKKEETKKKKKKKKGNKAQEKKEKGNSTTDNSDQ
ncbi:protocadherin alpha-5-like [Hemicordylus capensis]|uniref:protocadherin alpha-5-like n=1 Tax=Hemicordylus capensis TaxID=884348 RepID=UPI002304707D|nr:protocadherin alpha-5-like [Hemicordylus capensis]